MRGRRVLPPLPPIEIFSYVGPPGQLSAVCCLAFSYCCFVRACELVPARDLRWSWPRGSIANDPEAPRLWHSADGYRSVRKMRCRSQT